MDFLTQCRSIALRAAKSAGMVGRACTRAPTKQSMPIPDRQGQEMYQAAADEEPYEARHEPGRRRRNGRLIDFIGARRHARIEVRHECLPPDEPIGVVERRGGPLK